MTTLTLPTHLPYPIKVHSVTPIEIVNDRTVLFTYTYEYNNEELPGSYTPDIKGKLINLNIKKGQIFKKPENIGIVEEACVHPIVYDGLCAICGLEVEKGGEQIGHSREISISKDEIEKVEKEERNRLIKDNRLILVVDLDQTIIHVSITPPKEKTNNVLTFNLPELNGNRTYYLHLRPGLDKFLERMNELYEMHIYTMATKPYARAICEIIDPTGRLFGDRLMSRDESGLKKNLKRLFRKNIDMVVVLDDRGDVWDWCDQLVKVRPYVYFKNVGDINLQPGMKEHINGEMIDDDEKDKELQTLTNHLSFVNKNWFQNKGSTGEIIKKIKVGIFKGLIFLFSGIYPQGQPLRTTPLYNLILQFGGKCVPEYDPDVTHVVAANAGTMKVKIAKRSDPLVKIVKIGWIEECVSKWERVNLNGWEWKIQEDDNVPDKEMWDEVEALMGESESESESESDAGKEHGSSVEGRGSNYNEQQSKYDKETETETEINKKRSAEVASEFSKRQKIDGGASYNAETDADAEDMDDFLAELEEEFD